MKTGWAVGVVRMDLATINTLYLFGSAGYVSTPDAPANSITGDIDIVVRVSLADWAQQQALAAKYVPSGGNRAWQFLVRTGGTLQLTGSQDGSSQDAAISSTSTGFSAGTTHWVRVTWRNSDNRTQFFTSNDDVNDPAAVTWTQLGTDQTLNLTGLYDASVPVLLGISNPTDIPNLQMAGSIYYFELRNGIGGTVVQSFDPGEVVPVGTRDPSTVSAGGPWTINGTNWDWAAV